MTRVFIACTQIAGYASVYYTSDQLGTIDDFEDCALTLGLIEDWSSAQLDTLVELAKGVLKY